MGSGDVCISSPCIEPLCQAPPVIVEAVEAVGREMVKKHRGLETQFVVIQLLVWRCAFVRSYT